VPVAYEVARELGVPLDLLVVRKLGVPWQPEWGFGAIGEDGVCVLNADVIRLARLSPAEQAAVERTERAELDGRVRRYRQGRVPVPVAGRTAVLVDDGLATGSTAEAACRVVRGRGAAQVILAVPVGPERTISHLRSSADQVVCAQTLRHMSSVGAWYRDFTQTSDAEVAALLAQASDPASTPPAPADSDPPPANREV
jgi:putative phosphoribosyl transferase